MMSALFTGLVLIALVSRLTRAQSQPLAVRCIVIVIAAAVMFIPLYDVTIIERIRAFCGDLSVATGVLAMLELYYFVRAKPVECTSSRAFLTATIFLTGIIFYPLALGFGPWDPYSLGFQPTGMIFGLLSLALWCAYKGYILVLVWLVMAQVAFLIGFLESDNLWDYVMDPFIFIYAFSIYSTKFVKYQMRLFNIGMRNDETQ